MSSPWLDRNGAERFAELVDAGDVGPRNHRRHGREGELADLAALAQQLSQVDVAPPPDPEFRGQLRAFLMATIEREGIGATADASTKDALAGKTQPVRQVKRSPTTARTRLALLAGATVGALVLSGVSLASTDSVPGEALYQIKISTERAQLAMAGSDASRGQLYLKFAQSRLAEAAQVDHTQLAAVLAEMDRETTQGADLLLKSASPGDADTLESLTAFLDQQRENLIALQQLVPAVARPAVARSLAVLDRIQVRVDQLAAG